MSSPSSGTDNAFELEPTLDSAIKTNLVPYLEYYLLGSIFDVHVNSLLERLKGLCDNSEDSLDTFEDHEMSFAIDRTDANKPLQLRVSRSLDHADWLCVIRYVGIPELGDRAQPTAVRTSLDVRASNNVVNFLEAMGYRKQFEFVTAGYMFKKGRLKIIVAKVYNVKNTKNELEILDPITDSYFVEMSVIVPAGRGGIGHDMRAFADQLKPLVYMSKSDRFKL